IAEGLNLTQTAQVIAQAGLADVKTVAALVRDPGFINEFGLHAKTLEGYLFPDTYFFKRGANIRAMLAMMVRRTGRVFAEECRRQTHAGLDIDCGLLGPQQHFVNYPTIPSPAGRHKRLLRLSAGQALILASMVEKETGNVVERPVIAQVFLSRLRRHMRLQSDPTVMYGLQKFDRPLSRRDLKTPSPYNTYTLPALPAGPICSPGRAAIAAVMQPAGTNYYYFVAQGNGRHIFSQTLAAHNRAVRKYRRIRALKAD
ncbi:MAG: endolytic transglycosylase MltG, partial [Deltaproteobacteria bacterium]|nr:endolytic transglycosylase MltG [Deltaproteobacteria bacterium]